MFACFSSWNISLLSLRKVWQKRKCSVKNGFLMISHGTVRRQILSSHWSSCMRNSTPFACMLSANEKPPSPFFKKLNKEGKRSSTSHFHIIFLLFFPSFFYFEVFTWRVKRPIRTEQAAEEEKEEEKEEHKEKDDREKGGSRTSLHQSLRYLEGGRGIYSTLFFTSSIFHFCFSSYIHI